MISDPADVARVLELSDERDEWQRVCLARERAAFERGRREGWDTGRRALLDELAEAQRYMCQRVRPILMSPPFAELELRRWGPGGREHFGDPRPGQFEGRGGAAA
jgi:hypothetical protein